MVKLVGVVIIVASLVGGWFAYDVYHFTETPLTVRQDGAVFVIVPGTALKKLAKQLQREGVIEHANYFVWFVKWQGQARAIQAGEYRIEPGMTPKQFLKRIVTGDVIQYAFTIIEGWTFKQLMAVLNTSPLIKHTLTDLSSAEIMVRLGYPGVHPEGRFNPTTYHFPSNTTDIDVLKRAYREMETQLQQIWEGRAPNLPLKTAYEALTLASIVERETAVADERKTIAGVFIRRLKKRMRLQTDPTVIYGLGDAYDGNIRRKDLLKDNPYNTYTRRGLPPTPIAMPSKASIEAAVHPADGDALYFVARGDGSHYFSATLKEHNKAVREYQILRPRRARKAKKQ